MTHQNLILTEKAIKNHCKRLHKEMKKYNQDLSLGEIQNLFSRTLGFNNFYELKTVVNQKEEHHPFFKIMNNFEDKNNHSSIILSFVKPVKKINKELQKNLGIYIINEQKKIFGNERLSISKLDIDEQKCLVQLDSDSEFSQSGKLEHTINGVLYILTLCISRYLEKNGHDLFFNIEYGYKIKSGEKILLHCKDLISERSMEY